MATITLAANADWSTCNGGVPPGSEDDIYLNGYALNLDTGLGGGGNEFTCQSVRATQSDGTTPTAGTITMGKDPIVININLYAGTSAVMLTIAGETVTITGAVYGGTSTNCYAIRLNSGSLTTTSSISGGSASGAYGLYVAGGAADVGAIAGGTYNLANGCTIAGGTLAAESSTGSATVGAYGIYQTGGGSTIGTALGGGASGAHGIHAIAGTVDITTAIGGTVSNAFGLSNYSTTTSTVGTAKGGSAAGALGVMAYDGTVTINATDLTGTAYPVGLEGATLKTAAGVRLQFSDSAGSDKVFYGPDGLPAEADVREATDYGYSDFTGELPEGSGAAPPLTVGGLALRRA